MQLSALPEPSIIEELDFEQIKNQNKAELLKLIPDYEPLESDTFMLLIEAFSYKEMFLRKRINNSIKATLLSTATGSDLDNVAVFYGTQRLKSSKPYAKYKFILSKELQNDIKIPEGLRLTNDDNSVEAYLDSDVFIPAGKLEALGTVILDKEVASSTQTTEVVTTPLPFIFKVENQGIFENGAYIEDDEKFRARILQSLNRYSTAGSIGSYKYHTYSADVRIDDVAVTSEKEGVVKVYIHSNNYTVDDLMLRNVKEALEEEKVRPITDKVEIYPVQIKEVDIKGNIELIDITTVENIKKNITINMEKDYKIGEDLVLSDIIKSLHIDGVYKVELSSPTNTITTTSKEVVKPILDLEYIEASYE